MSEDPYQTFEIVVRQQLQAASNAVRPVGDPALQTLIHQAGQWLDHARGEVEKQSILAAVDAANLRIPSQDREALIVKAHDAAVTAVGGAGIAVQENLDALAEKLEIKSLPDAPRREDAAALREELVLRTRGQSPAEIALTLARLAGGADRNLAGLLVNTSYTSALLSGLDERGQRDALHAIKKSAIGASKLYGTAGEKAAAEALTTATAALTSASVARNQWARFKVEAIKETASRSKRARDNAIDRAQGVR